MNFLHLRALSSGTGSLNQFHGDLAAERTFFFFFFTIPRDSQSSVKLLKLSFEIVFIKAYSFDAYSMVFRRTYHFSLHSA